MPFWKKKNSDPQALHDASVTAFENGDYKTALKGFANLCDSHPTSERLYYLGVLLDMLGVPDKAVKALNESVKLDPKNAQAFYSLSIVQGGLENVEAAYNAVEKAHQIDPDDFRIGNHLALLMLTSPFKDHQNPQKALEISKHACELTGWQDPVCEATYKQALAATGNEEKVEAVGEKVAKSSPAGLTVELIEHFEKRFGRKANEMALQHIVPVCDVPVAVQTIESGKATKPNILFSTGMSFAAAEGDENTLRYTEVMMVVPGDMKMGTEIDDRIWPWQSLQHLALRPHVKGTAYAKKPSVVEGFASGGKDEGHTQFVATLMLPNIKGYVDRFEASNGRKVTFILAMPIYRDEYDLANQPGGPEELVKLIQKQKIKPHLIPNRKSLIE